MGNIAAPKKRLDDIEIDGDTKAIITALIARGQTRNEISSKTGAQLDVIDHLMGRNRGKAPPRTRSQTPQRVP